MKPRKRAVRADSDIARELRRVIDLEAGALRRVSAAVDGAFTAAVRLLSRCRGKVIVTGIGKSGLIGQKIAATFASTGTAAIYLHPAEGMHGDLGIVQRRDLVLAIGKSGESEELNAMLPFLKRLKVKIVALTANRGSTLSCNADLVLETPVEYEACPLNLAPTCSTTAALAVGDALAVALMKLRGFQRKHFAMLHPGGRLGRRLTLRVSDVMRAGEHNPTVRVDAPIRDMLEEMTRKRAGAVSVVDARGRLAGIVTDYDLRRAVERGEHVPSRRIPDVMNPRPTAIRSDRLAYEAVELMANRGKPFMVLPVVDRKRKAVGLVHFHDLRARGL